MKHDGSMVNDVLLPPWAKGWAALEHMGMNDINLSLNNRLLDEFLNDEHELKTKCVMIQISNEHGNFSGYFR